MNQFAAAPELVVEHWFNTPKPIRLADLRGRVVLIEAFQMLCPGCVSHGLPQAVKVRQLFKPEDVVVLGLHSVFEHHAAQGTKAALEAFLHEYRITFPVGLDAPSPNSPAPQTMIRYRLRGTPSLLLIDRQGRLRKQAFGHVEDMSLGAEIMALIKDGDGICDTADDAAYIADSTHGICDDGGCEF